MANTDPLRAFERLVVRMGGDAPPPLHVASQVMRRIRSEEVAVDRTFELLAAGCCAAAFAVAVLGLSQLSGMDSALETFVHIVPPIGL